MTTSVCSVKAPRSWNAISLAVCASIGRTPEMTRTPFTSRALAMRFSLYFSAASALKLSTCFLSSALSLMAFLTVDIRSGALLNRARRSAILSCRRSSKSSTALPVMASMRRTPAATLLSETMRIMPRQPVEEAWHPPQNSTLVPNCTTRTRSPYFSPKRAMAPNFLASSIGVSRYSCRGRFSRIFSFTRCSTSRNCSALTFSKWEKSKRKPSALTNEPFCST